MKNNHLHVGIFALMLSAANILGSFPGSGGGTPGLFANALTFDPGKIFVQESPVVDVEQVQAPVDAHLHAVSEDTRKIVLTFKDGLKTVEKIVQYSALFGFEIPKEWAALGDLIAVKIVGVDGLR